MTPRIVVEPADAPLDTPFAVRLLGFEPGPVTVRASTRDPLGRLLRSSVDIEVTGDDVEIPDPMRLIWALSPVPGENSAPTREKLPLSTVELTAAGARATVLRRRLPRGVRRTVVRENGLVGTLFHAEEGPPRPGVLLLGGSEGGLHEPDAALLAARGFTVLALAYFRARGLPADLVAIPVEYFGTALDFLRTHERVAHPRLGIIGGSRGGEAALLVASLRPEVRAVVSVVGSGVVTQGIAAGSGLLGIVGTDVPAWTVDGEPLPYLPHDIIDALVAEVDSGRPVRLDHAYPAECAPEHVIPVERIRGAVLLISAGDDRMWPSGRYSEVAFQRLAEHDHPHPFEHLRHPEAGHLIAPPPYGPATDTVVPGPGVLFDTGGTPEANARARELSWTHTVDFLHRELAA